MEDFPDVNVWIALTAEEHRFHRRAEMYFRTQARTKLSFCRITALGLVRVISHKHAFNGDPLTPAEAWDSYRVLRSRSEVHFRREPVGVEDLLLTWVNGGLVTARTWTDAYLSAFAIAGSLRLVTFDKDFQKFPGLELLHLDV